jgi:small subunit ribosomal protein S18
MAFGKRGRRRKVCRFCANPEMALTYKEPGILNQFLTDRGKIVPSRISGSCAFHQRALALEIKRARNVALLPFASNLPG